MNQYNLIIIGAGPAGLMAACRAGELGAKVIILEKNKRPGIKLLTTGGGRCNFTNNISDPRIMAARYLPNGRFLISALAHFGPQETISYFNAAGLESKIENNGRVFPKTNRAFDVLNVLLKKIAALRGEIRFESSVKTIVKKGNRIEKIILFNGTELSADNYLLATGGKSYPITGSTGDAYAWLHKLGHNIIKARPALVPLFLRENFIKDLQGLSLSDLSLSLFSENKLVSTLRGDLIFTGQGISGPIALDASRYLESASPKKYRLELDLFPDMKEPELDIRLQTLFHSGHKLFKNILDSLVPPKLAPVLFSLLGIAADKQGNMVTKSEKQVIIKLLKKFPLSISGSGDFSQAMITAGGADLKEIDPKTMRSKLISNLYIAGELLDLSGPTGGFNLQLCWSTGYIAGESSVDKNIHL
ncbi:MAG: NAD(P)/FAD-dependent oxidoreductase [Patescibacteria group bacterium]